MNTWPHEHQHHGDEGLWNNLKLYSVMNTWPHEHQHHGDDELWNKTTQFQEYMTPRTPAPWRWRILKLNCTESWTYDVTNTSIRRWWTVKQKCTVSSIFDVTNTSITAMMKCEANITVSGTHNMNTSTTAMMDCETTWNCTVSWIHDTTDTCETKLHRFMNTWRHEHQHHGMMNCEHTHYSVRNTRSVKQTLQCQEHTICKTNITVSGTHHL